MGGRQFCGGGIPAHSHREAGAGAAPSAIRRRRSFGGRGPGGGSAAGGLGGWGDRYPLAAVGAVCAGGAPTGEPKEPAKSKSGVRISSGQFSYELVLHIHT